MKKKSRKKTLALMIQGTASDAGKSLIVAGLARIASNQGLSVAPFKPQNMSNNAAVVDIGHGEIGTAQKLQAIAARKLSSVHMNPILLKPQGNNSSQLIIQGKKFSNTNAKDFYKLKKMLIEKVTQSFYSLSEDADIIIAEGAGSNAEVNLRHGDISNMGFASKLNLPVILVADIHRGGAIASIVGTHKLLLKKEINLIKGYIINKFRGDPSLFDNAIDIIHDITSWQNFGIIPWFEKATLMPQEDSMALENLKNYNNKSNHKHNKINIVVPICPHISNFNDINPLKYEKSVNLHFVRQGQVFPKNVDVIMLLGSKNTIGDFNFICQQGWNIDIAYHSRQGAWLFGICGGFQMLGHYIEDPLKIEGNQTKIKALGLLPFSTRLNEKKRLKNISGFCQLTNSKIKGYEMHLGVSTIHENKYNHFALLTTHEEKNQKDGMIKEKIMGCYIHDLFVEDDFRKAILKIWGTKNTETINYQKNIDDLLNEFADYLEKHIRVDDILSLASEI